MTRVGAVLIAGPAAANATDDESNRSARPLRERLSNPPLVFWLRHMRGPFIAFLMAAPLFAATRIDVAIADGLFFDGVRARWWGAGSWWANELIHSGGRLAAWAVVAAALVLWGATFFSRSLRALRRPAGFFIVAYILTVGSIGLLKMVTNVDCPWDLQTFGGRFPYIDLFAARPDVLRHARCFPAAHASLGYAFMALYFVTYERSRVLSTVGLGVGLALGLIFGVAQQARGAHFVSHDLWSAYLAWIIPLTLYAFAFNARLYAKPD